MLPYTHTHSHTYHTHTHTHTHTHHTHTHTHTHIHQGRTTRQKQQTAAVPPSDTHSPPTRRVAASRTRAEQGKSGGRQNSMQLSSKQLASKQLSSKQLSSKRVAPPRGSDSFSFDSDPESDISWEIKVGQYVFTAHATSCVTVSLFH